MVKVSILINNYNYEKFIEQCLVSLFNQTYKNYEIIVYDDGSKDNSLNILNLYKDKIKIIANSNYNHAPNENQANAIYQAFLQSTGEIICLLDSDDMFAEDKLEKVVDIFKNNERVTTVQNVMLEIDAAGKISSVIRPVIKKVEDFKTYIFEDKNFFHLFVPTSGLAFRKSFLNKVLPLQEDGMNSIWSDARLSLLSVFYGKIHTIMEPLTYYRIHSINDSNARGTAEGHERYLEQMYIYFNRLAKSNKLPEIEFSRETYLENTFFAKILNEEILREFTNNNVNVYIWGAGEAGQTIYHFLNKNNCPKIDGFFDANPKRLGEISLGLSVVKPNIQKGLKYIISPIHAYNVIKNQLIAEGLIEGVDFINPYKS